MKGASEVRLSCAGFQTCERRTDTDAPGDFYQKVPPTESPHGDRGSGASRRDADSDRLDPGPAGPLRRVRETHPACGSSTRRTALAGPEPERSFSDFDLPPLSRPLPLLRGSSREGSLGGALAARHRRSAGVRGSAVADAVVEGDRRPLPLGLEDRGGRREESGGVGCHLDAYYPPVLDAYFPPSSPEARSARR